MALEREYGGWGKEADPNEDHVLLLSTGGSFQAQEISRALMPANGAIPKLSPSIGGSSSPQSKANEIRNIRHSELLYITSEIFCLSGRLLLEIEMSVTTDQLFLFSARS